MNNKDLLKSIEKNRDIVAKLIEVTMGEYSKIDFLTTCFEYSSNLTAFEITANRVQLLENKILKYRINNKEKIQKINELINLIFEVTESKITNENISNILIKINKKEQSNPNKLTVEEYQKLNESWLTQKAKVLTNIKVSQKKIDEIIKELNIEALKELCKTTINAKLELNGYSKETTAQQEKLTKFIERYNDQRNEKIKKRAIDVEIETKKAEIDTIAVEQKIKEFINQSILFASASNKPTQNGNKND